MQDTLRSYSNYFPATLHFGSGCRHLAVECVDTLCAPASPRLLVVCSRSVYEQAPAQELLAALGSRVVAKQLGVPADPPLSCVDNIVAVARLRGANAFMALGGGSVMDATKTAALLAAAPSPAATAAYFRGELSLPARSLPLLALPTTAGTGAEITKNAVLTDVENNVKGSIRSPAMVPAAALVDPDFTLALPPQITADSGMDALTQALESYVSTGASELSRALAERAVALLLRWLPAAYADGADAEARLRVAEGSMLTALAFAQSGLGAVHGLAHPIGHALGLAHGLTCAILLPHIMRWNYECRREEWSRLARSCDLPDAAALLTAVKELASKLRVAKGFRELGLREEHFAYIVSHCRSGSMKANPRPMSDEEVLALLRKLAALG
jgi:alcohol dehydrogenase class IV